VQVITGLVPTDHGAVDSDRLARLAASLRARCSELTLNLQLCQTHSQRAYQSARDLQKADVRADAFRERFYLLTPRQRDVFERIFRGEANKVIAFDLHLSQRPWRRTVRG
jgi:DNA-binding NarL/FixJ family response regulator